MISVGTSFTYKKSVETTTTSTSTESDTTTEVEVSTVFDGLILGVVPFIEDNGRISDDQSHQERCGS
jgi:type II secretory pathway component GspD/PulD (secretin)